MKKLIDYKDEIHKCSKCGLCQSVCPIYKETGNDCAVSRGKFILLNGVLKNELKLNKNINKYLDMCLNCNACKEFCPSGIDAGEIFLTAKSEYFSNNLKFLPTKIFQSQSVFNSFLNFVKFSSDTYRKLKLDDFTRKLYPILIKFGWFGKKVILTNEFLTMPKNLIKNSPSKIQNSTLKVVYFKGCINESINKRTQIATEMLIQKVRGQIIPIENFQCCGLPFLTAGNAEQYKKQAIHNISQIPDDFDYFVTDCAGCQNSFKMYEKYIDDEKILKKLKKINEMSVNIIDFVLSQTRSIEFKEKINFTFHKPCHLENIGCLKTFLNIAKNVEYIEAENFDTCCGFSGEFAIKNKKISSAISAKKAKSIINTGADCVLTACPSCVLGIKQGMIEIGKSIPVINFAEFLTIADFKLNCEYENKDCNKKLFDAFVKGGF